MKTLRIAPAEEGKGRSFEATMLAMVHATMLQQDGNNTTRPVWLMYAGTDEAIRAFTANMRTGRKAEVHAGGYNRHPDRIELLKSAGYQYLSQRTSAGTVVTAFLPELFRLDPGMVDPKGIGFCLLPPRTWAARHAGCFDVPSLTEHVAQLRAVNATGYRTDMPVEALIPLAPLFAAFVDRRTRCPLVNDPRFHLQLLIASIASRMAWMSVDRYSQGCYSEYQTELVGLLPGLGFSASHEKFEAMLAAETQAFFGTSKRLAKAA